MLAEDMVRQCKGLPLAIVVLVGILQANDDWNEVHENLKSHLKRRQDDRGELIIDVLALSYDYLPRHLKPCFLYLGLFPYDSDISVERVINLWVAEGIILSSVLEENEVLEDVAYRYLLELVQRYMVQVEKRDPTGRIGICHMHDLMLDMCLSKAKDKDFFRIINLNFRNNSFVTNEAIAPHRIRRIAVHLNNFNGKVNVQYSSYRSILGFSLDGASGISQPFIESMVDNFKLLRVFDLEGVQGFAIPRNIKNLIHLRLLNVNSAWVGRLPSIGNFRYLLTLNLDPYDSAEEIPDVIWKLERLRHLYLPRRSGAKTKSLRLANLKDLQTLVNFPAPVANLEDLTTLPSLRKLVIRIADTITLSKLNKIFQAQGQARNKFIHLRSLSVYCSGWNVDMKPIRWKYDQMDVNFELDGALEDEKQIAGCCPWLCISRQKSESTSSSSSERQDINQIISCCPRLYVLMINGNIVYQI
ncbi:conserved hypothetical protein [Ricinus communis]|uniref:Uncharacterized protein n=2 Tax=Ricinus communis TaxID=3988 RepID=B9REJ6_RICCO|nr:conserved hypothetical protein [Ricinus communis]